MWIAIIRNYLGCLMQSYPPSFASKLIAADALSDPQQPPTGSFNAVQHSGMHAQPDKYIRHEVASALPPIAGEHLSQPNRVASIEFLEQTHLFLGNRNGLRLQRILPQANHD
ncbi:MAG: hypothetical protein RL324_1396 [Verrucomicrobiota bacterium]